MVAESFVVPESRVRAHHERMRTVALAMLTSAIVLGVVGLGAQIGIAIAGASEPDTLGAVQVGARALGLGELSVAEVILLGALTTWASVAAIAGAIFGVTGLRRAGRELATPGDLALTLDGATLTEVRRDRALRARVPIMGAQAFADHVQIVVGTIPQVDQVEVPVDRDERARMIALLRARGVTVGERPAFVTHFVRAIVIVPAVMIPAMIACRLAFAAIAWLLLGG